VDALDPERLAADLVALGGRGRCWIAYSGGLDSTVLLHALTRAPLARPLGAIHIDHGLQPVARDWRRHCRERCRVLGVRFVARALALSPPPGESLEAHAREARYRAFAALLDDDELLLTAHHLDDQAGGRARMRRAIDAWWPEIEAGCEAILVTASGCASMVREYGEALADDPDYAGRAARVAALARDPAEVLAATDLTALGRPGAGRRVAYHAPCSQQHVLRLDGVVEGVLERLGFTLTAVPEAHLCCGSAGTYSITQPVLSRRLLENKLGALEGGRPALIATANVGCQLQLAAGASVAVVHWLELLDPAPPEEIPER